MNKTKIEWTEATWNPVTGCTPISDGCANCYAKRMAKRLAGRCGYPKAPRQFDVTLHYNRLSEPLDWKKPRMIFVCSMSDLFHEDVPVSFIADVFDRMACATLTCNKRHEHTIECWQGEPHIFHVLTKRPERMLQVLTHDLPEYVGNLLPGDSPLGVAMDVQWPLPNVWLGVTAENQATVAERIPLLLQCPAAVRFVSIEPMLGPVDLNWVRSGKPVSIKEGMCCQPMEDVLRRPRKHKPGETVLVAAVPGLDWVIVGGETGPGARPMHPDWARSVRDQCVAANVPFFFKQWGEYEYQLVSSDYKEIHRGYFLPTTTQVKDLRQLQEMGAVHLNRVGKKAAGRILDKREWNEMPETEAQRT